MLALTVKEAAEQLGVSVSTVYWMCHQKEIPHNRVHARGRGKNGKILIPVKGLERWLHGDSAAKLN